MKREIRVKILTEWKEELESQMEQEEKKENGLEGSEYQLEKLRKQVEVLDEITSTLSVDEKTLFNQRFGYSGIQNRIIELKEVVNTDKTMPATRALRLTIRQIKNELEEIERSKE